MQLAAARALADAPDTPALRAELRTLLRRSPSPVAARAAQIIRARRLADLEDDLVSAWARFCLDPIKRDPSCAAKLAIIEALDELDRVELDLFAAAARLEQREPAWGPPVDTAPPVRARAALALGRALPSEALYYLGELLADEAAVVRRAAVDALECRGGAAATALLVLRFRAGDPDPVVYGECAAALIRLAPEHAVPLIAPLLRAEEDATLLGFSLAESRAPAALEALVVWLDETVLAAKREQIIAFIAAHRTDPAEQVLLDLIEDGSLSDARQAVTVLARRASTERARQRLREAVAVDPALARAAEAALAEGGG